MEQSEQEEMPTKDKENSGIDENGTFDGPSSLPTKAHYDAVKMKYFSSLGMNKPPTNTVTKRERGKTEPSSRYADLTVDLTPDDKEFIKKPISPARKRSISTPLNAISKGIPIPGSKTSESIHAIFQFDSDEELSGSDEVGKEIDDEAMSYRPGQQFIPPHEMLKKGGDFEVGTARSLAVWENQRRKKMNDLSN